MADKDYPHQFIFENKTDKKIPIYVEPWAADFWISPGEEFKFVPEEPNHDFYFSMYLEKDSIALFAEGGCVDVSVFCAGKQLECGHNRPFE